MTGNRLWTIVLALLLPGWHVAVAQPLVAASIQPLALIAGAVTDGVSEPALVLDAGQDAHHPALRPSQRRAMNDAQVFLWIGPQLETGLDSVAGTLRSTVLTAMNLPGLTRQYIGDTLDPHVWLDTRNAGVIATRLANTLGQLDPVNADHYQANLAQFNADLVTLESGISRRLQADSFPPFAVYHNGYQYFENQFGLHHATSFTSNEEVQPGIRQVLAIREQLADNAVNCIVVGPSQNTAFLDNQLDRNGMRYVTIDVLGHDIAITRDGYSRFMIQLAETLAGCRD